MKKSFCAFCILALLAMNITMAVGVANTEWCAARWAERVSSYEEVRQLNRELYVSNQYSSHLVEGVRMLAVENGLLCERDIAAAKVVMQYEEENRRLKTSLGDACKRLEEQIDQINTLMDEVENLRWQIKVLEDAIARSNEEEPPATDETVSPTRTL